MKKGIEGTIVIKSDPSIAPELKRLLEAYGCGFHDGPYMFYRAVLEEDDSRAGLSFYTSGKIVIQGRGAAKKELLLAVTGVSQPDEIPAEKNKEKDFEERIGSDESGKGDYFGPLVVAAVHVDRVAVNRLRKAGIMDSKLMSARSIRRGAEEIGRICGRENFEIVTLMPHRYNELYPSFGNLNKMLAWMHARAIETLVTRKPCKLLVVDRFARGKTLSGALMMNGRKMRLVEIVRGERDIAVAAGSVLARDEFVKRLGELSEKAGIKLPRGATSVVDAGRRLIKIVGERNLGDFAKLHFRTTAMVRGGHSGNRM